MERKSIIQMIEEIGVPLDEETLKVIRILEQKKMISETKLAEELGFKINSTRKLLYRLNNLNLATYEKKRDEKKKWWYVYFWGLDRERIEGLYFDRKKRDLDKRKLEIIEEEKYKFECKKCDMRFLHEDALEQNFTCPECGEMMTEITDSKIIKRLKQEINALGAEYSAYEERKRLEQEKEIKKRTIEEKKEEEAAERKKKREARKAKKLKPMPKKTIKKSSKKKK